MGSSVIIVSGLADARKGVLDAHLYLRTLSAVRALLPTASKILLSMSLDYEYFCVREPEKALGPDSLLWWLSSCLADSHNDPQLRDPLDASSSWLPKVQECLLLDKTLAIAYTQETSMDHLQRCHQLLLYQSQADAGTCPIYHESQPSGRSQLEGQLISYHENLLHNSDELCTEKNLATYDYRVPYRHESPTIPYDRHDSVPALCDSVHRQESSPPHNESAFTFHDSHCRRESALNLNDDYSCHESALTLYGEHGRNESALILQEEHSRHESALILHDNYGRHDSAFILHDSHGRRDSASVSHDSHGRHDAVSIFHDSDSRQDLALTLHDYQCRRDSPSLPSECQEPWWRRGGRCRVIRGVSLWGGITDPPILPHQSVVLAPVTLHMAGGGVAECCMPAWLKNEEVDGRRIIRVLRRQRGSHIYVKFTVLGSALDHPQPPPLHYDCDTDILEVSCIRAHEVDDESPSGQFQYYVTSVEVVGLVELLVGTAPSDTAERRRERGRVRLNLVTFWLKKPVLTRQSLELPGDQVRVQLAQRIMGYETRRPRGFDKEVRILPWHNLVPALARALNSYYAEITR